MKKSLIIGLGLMMSLSVISLAGCTKDDVNEDILNNDITDMTTTENVISCADSIDAYLNDGDAKGDGNEIKAGDNVIVHYIGRLSMDEVFDTSVESVAKACGTYNAQRNYNEGLPFEVGAGQMIPGFDEGVVGMKIGQTKTLEFPAIKGYGERSDEAMVKVELSNLPEESSNYEIGTEVMTQMGQKFKVHEITETHVIFDANHELAGKALIFDVTILEIK